MYFDMVSDIQVGKYRINMLISVEVHKSVNLLADTCTIVLPGTAYNQALHVENVLHRGDKVIVKFGYNDISNAKPEFEGYLKEVQTDDGSITLLCEDSIYLTRKVVEAKQFKNAKMSEIAEYLCQQVGGLTLECDYDIPYDKYVILNQTGFDVLKQLKDETAANIYLKGNVLHIHPPYIEKFGNVKYDFARNIEKSELQYRRAEDREIQVLVEGIALDGTRIEVAVGKQGGDRRSYKVRGIYSIEQLKRIGEEHLKTLVYTGYEGSITTWLIPYVEPGYSAHIHDAEYEFKDGTYYVEAVTSSFSEQGGIRKVEMGKILSEAKPPEKTEPVAVLSRVV